MRSVSAPSLAIRGRKCKRALARTDPDRYFFGGHEPILTGSLQPSERELLRLLLLLLSDADLEVLLLGFLECLVVVPRDRIAQIGVDIGVLGQDGHNREALVASRAERPEALYVRDCHTSSGYHGEAVSATQVLSHAR